MIFAGEEPRLRVGVAAALSCAILGLIFWGLFQIDLPFARFLRSLHISWLERTGDVGTRLGSGAALVAISIGLLIAGWVLKRADVLRAGLTSLYAHGIAAIVVQALKHGIGRPRPRLLHADNGFPWRPSLESGLDSFPSGHTTASFAVAAVLARVFPRIAWLAYGVAGFVAVSRAVRGSHFPADVMAGICLGTMIGTGFAYPLREWKRAMLELMAQFLPYLVLIFSLLWLMTHLPQRWVADFMLVSGGLVMAVGVGMRMYRHIRRSPLMIPMFGSMPGNILVVVGLALTTGLWVIPALTGTLALIQWLVCQKTDARASIFENETGSCSVYQAVITEIPLVAALTLAVVAIQHVKGLLPIF